MANEYVGHFVISAGKGIKTGIPFTYMWSKTEPHSSSWQPSKISNGKIIRNGEIFVLLSLVEDGYQKIS